MLNIITIVLLSTQLTQAQAQPPHVMDGQFQDWVDVPITHQDDSGLIRAIRIAEDPYYVYMQLDLDRPRTLQGLDEELRIELDLDGNDRTGFNGFDGLKGVDGIVTFSPLDAKDGQARAGSALIAQDRNGKVVQRSISPALGVVALPTHSGDRFEIRLNRLPAFRKDGFEGQVIARTRDGMTDQTTEFQHTFTTKSASKPPTVIHDPVEPIAPNRFRVMSWNGEHGALFKNGDPFARAFEATLPDIVLLQELPSEANPSLLQRWFDRLEGDHAWSAVVAGQQFRVAVVTPHPFEPIQELQAVKGMDPRGRSRNVRAVGGIVTINGQKILTASVHLKCCGRLGSSEDEKRAIEVEAIREAVRLAIRRYKPDGVVIGGDLNLVGSPSILERLGEGLSLDGQDLVVASPIRPAGDSVTTWERENQAFVPGRLDFILAGNNTAIERAVILDAAQMPKNWRRQHNLPDEAPSDHLAITVDLAFPPSSTP